MDQSLSISEAVLAFDLVSLIWVMGIALEVSKDVIGMIPFVHLSIFVAKHSW